MVWLDFLVNSLANGRNETCRLHIMVAHICFLLNTAQSSSGYVTHHVNSNWCTLVNNIMFMPRRFTASITDNTLCTGKSKIQVLKE